jgi:Na+-transporting NADH:ubiquinone oxidoreductase subunit NqrB
MFMFYGPAAPKVVSVLIFWSFFILIMALSLVSIINDKYRWYMRYARIYARAYRRR